MRFNVDVRLLGLTALLGLCLPVHSAPYTPANDSEVALQVIGFQFARITGR